MGATQFDILEYFEKLKAAGVPEEQAKVQANAFRDFMDIQDAKNRQTSGTKGDVAEVRLEIEKVRPEMKSMETRLLKWQLGIGFVYVAILARGGGWLGF